METSVLVVEDESIVALDIQTRLAGLGFSVAGHARDSSTAVTLARETQPDLILMDIQIAGDTDGIETAEIIGRELNIPSVFLTAYSDRDSLDRAKQSHGYGYLLKPFQEREMVIAIEMALFKHKTEGTLKTNRAILDATLNAIDEGVITLDESDSVVLLNRAGERLTGWPREEAVGRPISDVLVVREADTDRSRIANSPQKVDRKREGRHGAELVVRRDGTSYLAEIGRFPIGDKEREAAVIVVRDVTGVIEYQQRLIDARIAAESADRAKSEFMARMSHEFRTPLNTIMGMTRIVMDSIDDEEMRRNLQISSESAEEMMRFVTELLDYTAHDAGDAKPQEDWFSVRELSGKVIQGYALDASRRGIRLAVVDDPSVPPRVKADSQRVRQVLNNLLANAVKFTSDGWVVLSVRSREDESGNRDRLYIEFRVEDTGVGIPEDQLENVFQEFTQLQESRTRNVGGTGLGLAIARRFARSMDGDVTLESTEGYGTVARFQIPVWPDDEHNGHEISSEELNSCGYIASDAIVRRVIEPWSTRFGISLVAPDEADRVERSDFGSAVAVLTVDEFRDEPGLAAGAEVCLVTGPVDGSDRVPRTETEWVYVSEPLTMEKILAAVRNPCEAGARSMGNGGSSALHRLREMLHNQKTDAALEFIRECRGSASRDEHREVLFRLSLALRKGDVAGAHALLDQAAAAGVFEAEEEDGESSDS